MAKTKGNDATTKVDAPNIAALPDTSKPVGRDWGQTLFLPKTEFPMRAGLPQAEPKMLERWKKIELYKKLRAAGKGRPKFVLHDGPPYANGNIHIGHALNKILKDLVTRSQQMAGHDSNYVPGWDCHGLPIEWKIEEEYRAKGRKKDDVPAAEFRRQCRDFASNWLNVQREEFKRLGVEGDWTHPYSTMDFKAEGTIAAEIMKVAMTGALYRGSKPIMWSVVEKTALAEAEVEYHPYTSDMVWVKFPIRKPVFVAAHRAPGSSAPVAATVTSTLAAAALAGPVSIVIWTTTPWTLPGNRAISYFNKIAYGLYEVTAAPENNWAKVGDKYVLADKLAAEVMKAGKVETYVRRADVSGADLAAISCDHPLGAPNYPFEVPLLDGDHVTDDAGTGFVHTAPGHGREDFDIWLAKGQDLARRGIDTTIPFTVDGNGFYTKDAPGFEGARVITDKGEKGNANEAVIKALQAAGNIIARGRLKHDYPHSWRSKKPVIFRNTPQWFIAMDKALPSGKTLRETALAAIAATEWVPASGQNRLRGMIEVRPDWVISRQRAWGVPITVFAHKDTGQVIPAADFTKSDQLMQRITTAICDRGADAWFEAGAAEKFLTGLVDKPAEWEQVTDILDVWFDSGSTHAFTLEDPQQFPGLAGIERIVDGGRDRVMYLEGSDQHRGWFHSSLLESCATRGRAPYDVVLTHGFCLDDKGRKMAKSEGNVVAPQTVIKDSGADILRLWVAASDYSDDLRIGPEILKTFVETYKKMRNSLRWMLGTLAHYDPAHAVAHKDMPELERLMLHRLTELSDEITAAYAAYDYKKVVSALSQFMNTDLSAFYFDIRKDALYCEAPSSTTRRAALTAIEQIFRCVTVWLAPILVFTAEESWLARYPSPDASVHLEQFPKVPAAWRDAALDAKWDKVRRVRRVVTGALEIERANKKIGSSLEAAPTVYVAEQALADAFKNVSLAEIAITSTATLKVGDAPAGAFTQADSPGIAVIVNLAKGRKCARSWRITEDVGSDPGYADLSARDAVVMREIDGAPRTTG